MDIDKYPLYIHTTKWRCTLKAGDVIFIPGMYYEYIIPIKGVLILCVQIVRA